MTILKTMSESIKLLLCWWHFSITNVLSC